MTTTICVFIFKLHTGHEFFERVTLTQTPTDRPLMMAGVRSARMSTVKLVKHIHILS